MIRFHEFGGRALELLLPPNYASQVKVSEIQTQRRLLKCGCPDILIDSREFFALVEVKLDLRRGCTNRQIQNDEDADTETYLDYLTKIKNRKTCLTFLVPKRWHDRTSLEEDLKNWSNGKYSSIQTKIVYWEEILDIARRSIQKTSEPLLGEFLALLMEEFMPITFSAEEIIALFSSDFAGRFETIRKLEMLVSEIDEKAKRNKYVRYLETRRPDEFGIYFKDSERETEIWFGIWPEFWKHLAAPLSFGIKSGNKSLVEAFRALCGGPTQSFGDYTLRSFDPEIVKTLDPVEAIWEQLEPVLKNILGRGALGKVS